MNSIILIAAPSAGKGVIADYLVNKYNYVHMSMGNLIRNHHNDRKISNILKKGKLINDELATEIFENFIKENMDKKIIFDGFPRTMKQVSIFENIINKYNIAVDKLIIVDIDKDIAIKRIKGRVLCSECNHVFNKYIDNVNDMCPKCNGKLFTRNDDNIDSYKVRYDLFVKETMSVIDYLKAKYNFSIVDNNNALSDTYKQIEDIMKE